MMRWRSSAERETTNSISTTTVDGGEGEEDAALRDCSSLDDDEPDSSSPDPQPEEKESHRGRLETTSENDERLVPADGHFEDEHNHVALEEEKKQSEDNEPEEPPDPVIDDDDDDGSDHAEPPKVPWKPQNVQSTCEFTHTIADYAAKRESGCKKAEYSATTVDDFGNRWRLIVYVNGNGRASNHHLSLFLQVADADDLPFGWKKAVSYVLTLEHPNGGTQSYAKRNPDKTFKLCPKAIDWGWSQFITSDRIQQEGFVCNDALTVRASVTVKSSSVSIDEEDAELYLKCAVEEGDAEAVKLCIEQGASVNCKFKDDLYTPLHTACSSGTSRGSMEVLNLLLEEGADGNACNKWRETPLLIAANNGHLAAVEALLKHGANPSLCSEAGWSALTFAAHKGYDDIVALLLKAGAPVGSLVAEDNSTPLHKACAGSKPGHLASVKLLLEAGADVHALNKWRETPLLTAANHGQAGAVEALLAAGADPCKCTDTGWSPLSIAAYKGHDDVVRLLLEDGAPTEEVDPTLSALLQAATKGLPDTVELLLSHGADHTVTTKKGDTALSILVEQNLIDAAVEMVTEYNASIPRCSRDRKKVQRARLLINHRMKQLEREGKNASASADDDDEDDDDDETDHDESSGPHSAQHENGDSDEVVVPRGRGKKKTSTSTVGSNRANKMTAEEKARAAEEALLMELAEEEDKAKKEEAEANTKRAKKKKKKERERQQKLKEECERREKEEKETKERERERKEKEEKLRKELELKAKVQRDKEAKELVEREKLLAAKRKEKEKKEKEDLKKQNKESKQNSPTTVLNGAEKKVKSTKEKKIGVNKVAPEPKLAEREREKKVPRNSPPVAPLGGNRRWETKAQSPSAKASNPPVANGHITRPSPNTQSAPPTQTQSAVTPVKEFPVRTPASSPMPKSNSDISANAHVSSKKTAQPPETKMASNVSTSPKTNLHTVEHPTIALFRREKVSEMLQRCTHALGAASEPTVRRTVYRWLVRATHMPNGSIDPLIPSWNETEELVTFFQRQFISESRRGGMSAFSSFNIESLKEAGSSMALLCQNLAKEVDQFRSRVNEHLPPSWSDTELGMKVSDAINNENERVVAISWTDRATVYVPSLTYSTLRSRYVGQPGKFLASVFVAKVWYETKQTIMTDTTVDVSLPQEVKSCLASELSVSAELWSDPFNAHGSNVFWGSFEEVDHFFGGQKPFSKHGNTCDDVLARHGGSIAVLPPLDNLTATQYVQRIVDLLEAAEANQAAISFAVFLHAECFHDSAIAASANDLQLLDPRLSESRTTFVRRVETFQGGHHLFQSAGNSNTYICPTNTLFVLLQNDAGFSRYRMSGISMSRVFQSMSPAILQAPMVQPVPVGFPNEFHGMETTPRSPQPSYLDGLGRLSPEPQILAPPSYGAIGGSGLLQTFSPVHDNMPRGSRRGRLFDLVDDGEEEQIVDVDVVSGMLNSLDVGLFQNSNPCSDVDIEAISLMGIGGRPPMQHMNHGNSRPTHFG